MKFGKILAQRKTSDAANAGFWAGLFAGILEAVFSLTVVIVNKELLLKEFAEIKNRYGVLIPYDTSTLYLITLITTPFAIILMYLIVGILFGVIFEKIKGKPGMKAFILSILFGVGFGLTTNLPMSRASIMGFSVFTWLLFAFVFLAMYHKQTRKEKEEKVGMDKKNRSLSVFLIVLFALSFGLAFLCRYFRIRLVSLAPVYMFMPFLATLLVMYFYKIPFRSLGISMKLNKWYIVAWLLPGFLALFSLGISLLLPGTSYSANLEGLTRYHISSRVNTPLPPLLYFLILALIAGPTINAIFAFGEEIGWRGFLYKETRHLGFWKYSLFVGLIWGVWHAPVVLEGYNYPEHPLLGVLFMIIFCVAISPIFGYIREKSDSVIAAAIMHGSLNAFAGISVAFVKGSDLIVGLQGISGFIALAMLDFLILLRGDYK